MRLIFTALLVIILNAPVGAGSKSASMDTLGDPLPDYAVGRLGSTRWRQHWSIVQLTYSRDGKTVTAKSYEEGVCVFDAKTGTRLTHLAVKDVAYGLFTFSADGRWFAMTGPEDLSRRVVPATIFISSAETGKTRSSISLGNAKALALSEDGTLLATADQGSKEPGVTVWDAVKGKTLWQASIVATDLQFTPDDKTLLIANDKRLRLWDVASGKEQRRIEGDARKFALSQDGTTLATRGDHHIRIVDFATGDERRRIPTRKDLDTRFDRLAISSDGALVALAGNDYLFAWETATGKERFERKTGQWHTTVAFAPQSNILTWSCMYQPVIQRWDLASGKDLRPTAGHLNHVQSVAFIDAETVISSGSDAQAYRWKLGADAAKQPAFSTLESRADISHGRTAASADGKRLAVLGPGPNVTLLDAMSGKRLRTLEGGPMLFALAFSPDGKHVAAGDTFYGNDGQHRGRVYIWNADTGARTHFIEGGHGGMVRALAFSPDSKTLATGCDGMRLWDVATGKQVRRFLDSSEVGAIAFSPDGKTLATAGQTTIIWNAETGEPRHRLGTGFTHGVAIAPGGTMVATAGGDGLVRLWDLKTGSELAQLRGHAGRVHAISFSPDGKRLASGSEDTTVLIWDVSTALAAGVATGKPALTPAALEAFWADLAKADAQVGFKAVMALSSAPGPTLAYFKIRLKSAEREEKIIESTLPVPAGDLLRTLRAIEVLERMGTSEAEQLLELLANGQPARMTSEARSSLERLQKRRGKS